MLHLLSLFTLGALLLPHAYAQQQQSKGRDRALFEPIQPDSATADARKNANCGTLFRSLDGTCTNPTSNSRKLWGSSNLAQFSYFPGRSNTVPGGAGLKSAREISNILFRSCGDIFDPRGLSEMATFFGQFIDHNIVASPSSGLEGFNIPIPANDPVFGNSSVRPCTVECTDKIPLEPKRQLVFFRSNRVRVSKRGSAELPQNSLPSALDLVGVYGPNKERNNLLRTGRDGFMRTSMLSGRGPFLPLNTGGYNNAPDSSNPKFFLAGDHRANEHGVLLALHTMFLREHNSIAAELKKVFGWTNDRQIYENARKINGAQFQKIVFKDWLPAMTGRAFGKYHGFKERVNVGASVLFSTAGFRVGHTLVGNKLNRRGAGNSFIEPLSFCEMFFNVGTFFARRSMLENVVRGALQNRAQKVDIQVRNSLRNFLFEHVHGEEGFDLVSMNLQRARDHNLPTYNEVRVKMRLAPARRFSDITSDLTVQSNLMNAYGVVEKVEAWPGMLAEELMKGSSLTPTIFAIWMQEFTRFRDGDRFYYENGQQFPNDQMAKIRRVRELFDDSVDTLRGIVLRNSDIAAADLPANLFKVDPK